MKQIVTLAFLIPFLFSCFFQEQDKKVLPGGAGWKHHATGYFSLHAQAGVRSEDSLRVIGKKIETIQHELLALLQEQEAQNLEVYFLKDRETLTSYTGFPAKGYTNTNKGIIYFVDKDPFHLAFRHELMHALTWRLWGPPKGYWLSEGIAVFASRKCAGYGLHTLANAISRQNKVVAFQNLTDAFDFQSPEPSFQSASLVQYIYDNYGITALKAFWQNGLKNAATIIGLSPSKLEKRWKEFVDQEKFKADINWGVIKANGCE
jgi:hypothetical protein